MGQKPRERNEKKEIVMATSTVVFTLKRSTLWRINEFDPIDMVTSLTIFRV
jgi:hypothetical protein